MTDTSSWADLNKDGRRLERIIKDMNTKIFPRVKRGEEPPEPIPESLYFAYVDRIVKTTNSKVNVAEIVLNIKKTLKEAQKLNPQGAVVIAK